MIIKIATVVFFISNFSFAENTQILKCRVANPVWNSVFILDAIGAGFLTFSKKGDSRSYSCALKLDFINDGQRAIVPNVIVEFSRVSCDPERGDSVKEVLSRFTLIINTKDKSKPEGKVQWLRTKQPDECIVDKLSMWDITTNTKKWQNGSWGRRSTASEPKSK